MKITFLGTGVGKFKPGPGFRTDTTTLFDSLLVDAPATLAASMEAAGVRPDAVQQLVYTHSHGDHYDADTLRRLLAGGKLDHVAAHTGLAARIREQAGALADERGTQVVPLEPGAKTVLGPFSVLALEANHHSPGPGEVNLNYLIEGGGKRVLYLVDACVPPMSAVKALVQEAVPADALIIDATLALRDVHEHMFVHCSLQTASRVARALRAHGALRPEAPVYGTHFARTHLEFKPPVSEDLEPLGVRMAEEGGCVEV
ncbi:MAG: MBL fold metallo-hydrolase [Kiritimatiellae bacterium]|nr:MBL fold metallo-hydrolase [Kiritimatiellia bacterium]